MIQDLGNTLTKEDHERFSSLSFEVVRASNGHFYIRPLKEWFSHSDWATSQAIAISEGFSFDSQGDILNYTKPET